MWSMRRRRVHVIHVLPLGHIARVMWWATQEDLKQDTRQPTRSELPDLVSSLCSPCFVVGSQGNGAVPALAVSHTPVYGTHIYG